MASIGKLYDDVMYATKLSKKLDKLWDDVLFTVELYKRRGVGLAMFYALQDYCSASKKSLALVDVKFTKYCVASFFKDNKHYMMDIPWDMDSNVKAAVFASDSIAIVPTDIGTNLRQNRRGETRHLLRKRR